MFCLKCGKVNHEAEKTCIYCNNPLHQPADQIKSSNNESSHNIYSSSYNSATISKHTSNEENKIMAEYKAIIGEHHRYYYLNKFQQFDKDGKTSISWNWPVLFIAFYWLLYRKMWGWATLYFLISLIPITIVFTIGFTIGFYIDPKTGLEISFRFGSLLDTPLALRNETFLYDCISLILVLFSLCLWLIPPMYANAIYYRHCKSKILQTYATPKNETSRLTELTQKGGTSYAWLVALILKIIAMVGIIAAIAIPKYQAFAQLVQVDYALAMGRNAAVATSKYYQQNGRLPHTLAEAGFNDTDSTNRYIKSLDFDNQNGEIDITLDKPENAQLKLNMYIYQHKIFWKCRAQGLKQKYLPPDCKNIAE